MRKTMKKEKSCGTIIIENNKVLLIQQTDNAWGFPKGHVENNEKEQETAIRETKEETNLDVEIISNKKYITNYKINNEIDKEVIFFLAKKTSDKIKKQDEEIKNIKWVDLNQAFDIITYENTKDIYKEVLKDIN